MRSLVATSDSLALDLIFLKPLGTRPVGIWEPWEYTSSLRGMSHHSAWTFFLVRVSPEPEQSLVNLMAPCVRRKVRTCSCTGLWRVLESLLQGRACSKVVGTQLRWRSPDAMQHIILRVHLKKSSKSEARTILRGCPVLLVVTDILFLAVGLLACLARRALMLTCNGNLPPQRST